MKLKILLVNLLLVSTPAYAGCSTNKSTEFNSGVPETISVCATIDQLLTVPSDSCDDVIESQRHECEEMITYTEYTPHPCEINPSQLGCKFYNIEPASGNDDEGFLSQ